MVVAYLLVCFVSSLQSIFVTSSSCSTGFKDPLVWLSCVTEGAGAGERAVLCALGTEGILWDAVYFGYYSNHFNKPEQRNKEQNQETEFPLKWHFLR